MKGRKGETSPGGMTAGFVIAGAFLILVVTGIFFVSNRASDAAENLPQYEERVIQACTFTGIPIGSYCTQLRTIGKDKYVTCDYAVEFEHLIIKGSADKVGDCKKLEKSRDALFKLGCEEKKYSGKDLLNGLTCDELKNGVTLEEKILEAVKLKATFKTCEEAGGKIFESANCPRFNLPLIEDQLFQEKLGEGIICCTISAEAFAPVNPDEPIAPSVYA